MTATATDSPFAGGNSSPDQGFRIAFGVYAGVIAASVALVGVLLAGVWSAGVLSAVGFATLVVASVLGGVAVGRWDHGPERAGGSVLRNLLMLPGAVLIVGSGVAWVLDAVLLAIASVLLGSLALAVGATVTMMCRTRYVVALCGDSTPEATWVAEASQPARRLRFFVVGLVLLAAMVGIFADLVFDLGITSLMPMVGGLGGALLGGTLRSDTLHAYEAGIEIERPINRGFLTWDQIGGYRLTEEELRIERPWRMDYRCDRSAIDDVDAVVDTLEAYVD
jgi:hypothetical protein